MIPNIGMSYYTTSNSHGKHNIHNRGEIIYEVLKAREKILNIIIKIFIIFLKNLFCFAFKAHI